MPPDDDHRVQLDRAAEVIALYDDALPHVYGYVRSRCHDTHLAEELTADTFLAAIGHARRGAVHEVSTPWLLGIARHKLIDHWRRQARRGVPAPLDGDVLGDDPWERVLDEHRVATVLERLGAHHRSALTLRYIDGLPVPEVAEVLDRTVHATEALLVRARHAFRAVYEASER